MTTSEDTTKGASQRLTPIYSGDSLIQLAFGTREHTECPADLVQCGQCSARNDRRRVLDNWLGPQTAEIMLLQIPYGLGQNRDPQHGDLALGFPSNEAVPQIKPKFVFASGSSPIGNPCFHPPAFIPPRKPPELAAIMSPQNDLGYDRQQVDKQPP